MECTQLVDLIFFMGQSNMAGRGDAALAPAVTPGMGFEYRAVTQVLGQNRDFVPLSIYGS